MQESVFIILFFNWLLLITLWLFVPEHFTNVIIDSRVLTKIHRLFFYTTIQLTIFQLHDYQLYSKNMEFL